MSTGDHPDFADFYRREFPRLARSLRPLVGHAADDVAQEAFMVAAGRWAEVGGLDAPYGWVRKVALRIAGRLGHRDRHRVQLERHEARAEPVAAVLPDLDVIDAVGELPERDAAALWLHHFRDRSMREVAGELGCTEGAAKVIVHRSRRSLATRTAGLRGRWVSTSTFTVDTIAGHLRDRGAAQHIDTVVDDLRGWGGRWELTVDDGRYALHRDDGFELDQGQLGYGGGAFRFAPTFGVGEFALRVGVDADVARFEFASSTTPPTKGVPDPVWATLFYSSSPFQFAGRPRSVV